MSAESRAAVTAARARRDAARAAFRAAWASDAPSSLLAAATSAAEREYREARERDRTSLP